MKESLFTLIKQFMELQEELRSLESSQVLEGLHPTELLVLKTVGEIGKVNVTELAKKLGITKGTVSKTTRKLIAKNLMASFMEENNNQKVFFELNRQGQILYNSSLKQDERWRKRNLEYLSEITEEERRELWVRLQMYNRFLREEIEKARTFIPNWDADEQPEEDL